MAFYDTTVIIDGVKHYPFQSIPMEEEGSDVRQAGVVVTFRNGAGEPMSVRRADASRTAVTSMNTSSVNGVVPSLYAPSDVVEYVCPTFSLVIESLAVVKELRDEIGELSTIRTDLAAIKAVVESLNLGNLTSRIQALETTAATLPTNYVQKAVPGQSFRSGLAGGAYGYPDPQTTAVGDTFGILPS